MGQLGTRGETVETALPRYAEIRRDLENLIMSGAWRPGDRVPSEHDLMAQYRCSRMTVNKAVSALAEAGLVVRRRRSGSFVATPQVQTSALRIPDIKAEVLATGRAYRYAITARSIRPPQTQDLQRLAVEHAGEILALTVVHYAADRPFGLEDRIISLDAVPEARRQRFAAAPPGTWLLAHIPWSRAQHVIRATAASSEVATLLDIPRGSPCLTVARRTWQAGTPLTHVRLSYPGEAHELIAGFDAG